MTDIEVVPSEFLFDHNGAPIPKGEIYLIGIRGVATGMYDGELTPYFILSRERAKKLAENILKALA